HPFGEPAIATEDQAAYLACTLAARVICWAVAKIKVGPNNVRRVRAAVMQSIPTRISVQIFDFAIDRHLVQPDLTTACCRLHHIEESEPVESRPVGFVTSRQVTDSL